MIGIKLEFGCRFDHVRNRWVPICVLRDPVTGDEVGGIDLTIEFRRMVDRARRCALENGIAGKQCGCDGKGDHEEAELEAALAAAHARLMEAMGATGPGPGGFS